LGGAMKNCPICKSKMAIDFLSTIPNKPGDYMACCVSYNNQKNCYEKSGCGYWELYKDNILIEKAKE
jgi:hypothetical protein